MRKALVVLAIAALLTGCASTNPPLEAQVEYWRHVAFEWERVARELEKTHHAQPVEPLLPAYPAGE